MNQSHVGQCPIIDEQYNVHATMFFYLLKDSDEPLWDSYTNHSQLLVVVQVFTIKSDHGLSGASYDRIIK